MNVFGKISDILKELSGMEDIEIKDNLQEDLALDSLCMVTLLVNIEDEFQIVLDESDMNPFELNTVEDAVKLAEKYIGDKNE